MCNPISDIISNYVNSFFFGKSLAMSEYFFNFAAK